MRKKKEKIVVPELDGELDSLIRTIKPDRLSDLLAVVKNNQPTEVETKNDVQELSPTVVESSENSTNNDFEFSREKLHDVIDVGIEALQDLSKLTKASCSPRYFEVLADIMRTIAGGTKELMDLHHQLKKNQQPSKKEQNITNNNLYVTTNELMELLKNHKKNS